MNAERRFLLKAMTLGSLAGLAGAHSSLALARGNAQAGQALPTLALVSDSAAQSAFVEGIAASPAAGLIKAQRTGLGIDFILDIDQRLRSGQPQRIIGLVDDASGTLILDVARSAGARVQWLGQHSVTARESRHRLLSAESAMGCAAQLGGELNACHGDRTQVDLRLLDGHSVPAAPAGQQASGEWTSALGYLLASLGSTGLSTAPTLASISTPLTGNFVSFSIEA